MIDDLLCFIGDVLCDLLHSFRNGSFYGKEWIAKLIMRLIMASLMLLCGLLFVCGSGILKVIGIAGGVVLMIGLWRLEDIWHKEYMESRNDHKKEDPEKASN